MSTKLITQLNPFSTEHNSSEIENSSIAEIIAKLDKGRAVNTGWRVLLNDEIITDFQRMTKDGDTLYIKLVPEGDASAQDIGTAEKWVGGLMTAVGAVLVFTGVGAGIGAAMIGAGIGLFAGGVALYNMDLSVKDREKPEQSPSLRGSRNHPRPLGFIPILFGKRRIYPDPAANPYTWVDENGDQYLYQLFCCGQKDQVIDTSSIKIGETAIELFSASGSINQVLEGTDELISLSVSQGADVPPLMNKCVHEDMHNSILFHETEEGIDASIISTTPSDTEEINVDIFFYNGLGKYDDNGSLGSTSVEVEAFYKKESEDDSHYQLLGYFNSDSNVISGSELKTKRFAVTKTGLEKGRYTVKISRKTVDSKDSKIIDAVYLGSIRSVKNQQPVSTARCRELTLLGLKIKVSSKLNGYVEELNFISQSINKVYDSNTNTWKENTSSNPASAAMYAMQGEMSQQKLNDSEIDWPAFEKLYNWCSLHEYECNEYVYDSISVSEVLNSIASTCRAEIFRQNGKITVIQDISRDGFVQVFTPRNSWGYKENIIKADIPDALSLMFPDSDSGYAQQELKVYNTPDGNYLAEPETVQDVSLWGVTSNVQARKLGMYKYAVTKNRPIVCSFSVDFEYMLCSKGDWIKYAGDIALAGLTQGRIAEIIKNKEGRVTGFYSDEEIPAMENQKKYSVRVRLADGTAVLISVKNKLEGSKLVEFEQPEGIDLTEGCLFTFGLQGEDSIDLIITDIQCNDDFTAEITAVNYSPEIFGVDDPDFILPDFDNRISEIPIVGDSGEFINQEIKDLTQKTIPDLNALYKAKKDANNYTDSKIAQATFEKNPIYSAIFNTSAIRKGNDGSYAPANITASGRASIGDISSEPYQGNWYIYVNGGAEPFAAYIGETSFNLPIENILQTFSNIDSVTIDFKSNNDQVLIDTQTIPILSGSASYAVTLDNQFQSYEANGDGSLSESRSVNVKARVFFGLKELQYLADEGWEYGAIETPEGFSISVNRETGVLTITALAGSSMADYGNIEIPVFIHSQTNTEILIGYERDIARAKEEITIGYDGISVGYLKPDENGFYYSYFTYQKLSKTAWELSQLSDRVDGYWRILSDDRIITIPEKNTLEVLYKSIESEFNSMKAQFSAHNAFINYENAFNALRLVVLPIINSSDIYTFDSEASKNAFNATFESYYSAKTLLNKEIASKSTNFTGIHSVDQIRGLNPKPTDYFVWTNENATPYGAITLIPGMTYTWNGSAWVEDNDTTHVMATMNEALDIVKNASADSNIPAVVLAKRLIAMKVITDELYTNFASIQSLSSGNVIIGGHKNPQTGEVEKFLTPSDVNNAISQTLSEKKYDDQLKEKVNNTLANGKTIIVGGYFNSEIVDVDTVMSNDVIVKKKLRSNGLNSITDERTKGFFFDEDGNARINELYASNGHFSGEVNATSGTFQNCRVDNCYGTFRFTINYGDKFNLLSLSDFGVTYGKDYRRMTYTIPCSGKVKFNYNLSASGVFNDRVTLLQISNNNKILLEAYQQNGIQYSQNLIQPDGSCDLEEGKLIILVRRFIGGSTWATITINSLALQVEEDPGILKHILNPRDESW